MLGLSVGQVRSYVRAGFLEPARGPRGELLFSFQDLVLLRTAKGLVSARIAPRRVKSALRKLRDQLPEGRPLRGVHIRAEGDRIVVGDGGNEFEAESGQVLFDFGTEEIARQVAPIVRRLQPVDLGADDWYERGCDLEESAPADARKAYAKAIDLQPDHADAHVNLGRLLHGTDDARAAVEHYRRALEAAPGHAIAAFNLGFALEDLGLDKEAILAYRAALQTDGAFADAHFNLAHVYERNGNAVLALRHLRTYRKLVQA